MPFLRLSPRTLSVTIVALATAACGDATAPATAGRHSPIDSPPGGVSWAVLVKPKKPVIESVQLSTTALELNSGLAASYSLVISNPIGRGSRTYTDAFLQSEIRQGGVVVPAGGYGVRCNAGANGLLPPGTCNVLGLTINTMGGGGILTAGPADFLLTLYSQSDAFPSMTFTVPVMLGEALVTP